MTHGSVPGRRVAGGCVARVSARPKHTCLGASVTLEAHQPTNPEARLGTVWDSLVGAVWSALAQVSAAGVQPVVATSCSWEARGDMCTCR